MGSASWHLRTKAKLTCGSCVPCNGISEFCGLLRVPCRSVAQALVRPVAECCSGARASRGGVLLRRSSTKGTATPLPCSPRHVSSWSERLSTAGSHRGRIHAKRHHNLAPRRHHRPEGAVGSPDATTGTALLPRFPPETGSLRCRASSVSTFSHIRLQDAASLGLGKRVEHLFDMRARARRRQ